jgi:hypothetical protein
MALSTLYTILIILAVLAAAWTIFSWLTVRGTEKPAYKVVKKIGGLEIREYKAYIVAEYEAKGDYRQAATAGFMAIADYIFGNNKSQSQVKMTAPVLEKEIEPKGKHTAGNAARNGEKIKFRKQPAYKAAVISFSWWLTPARREKKKALLLVKIKAAGLTPKSAAIIAGYNPPFSAPWMHYTEAMCQID